MDTSTRPTDADGAALTALTAERDAERTRADGLGRAGVAALIETAVARQSRARAVWAVQMRRGQIARLGAAAVPDTAGRQHRTVAQVIESTTTQRDGLHARLATLGAQLRVAAIERAAWRAERERLTAALTEYVRLDDTKEECAGCWSDAVKDARAALAGRTVDDDLAAIRREWGVTPPDCAASEAT